MKVNHEFHCILSLSTMPPRLTAGRTSMCTEAGRTAHGEGRPRVLRRRALARILELVRIPDVENWPTDAGPG